MLKVSWNRYFKISSIVWIFGLLENQNAFGIALLSAGASGRTCIVEVKSPPCIIYEVYWACCIEHVNDSDGSNC